MRKQHYRFAHTVLMTNVLLDPEAFWSRLESLGDAALLPSWQESADGLGPEDLVQGTPTVQPMSPAPDARALVITMPAPQSMTECYWVALVRVGQSPPRYFVAERGADAEGGRVRAYWAEWKRAPGGGVMRVRGDDLPAITPEALLSVAVSECQFVPPGAAPPGGMPGPGMAPMPGPGMYGPGPGMPGPGMPGPYGQAPYGGPPNGPYPQQGMPPGNYPPGQWGPGGARMGGFSPPKKSNAAKYGCFGCLGFFVFVLLVGGILLYLEEGKGLHPPDTEVANVPVRPGVPFKVEFVWNDWGYAFNNIFLVIEDGQKDGGQFEVQSTVSCEGRGYEEKKTISVPGYDVKKLDDKGSSFSAWIYLADHYKHGSPHTVTCTGTVTPTKGSWTKAHIGVTQRQRPSDFFAR
ncbi:MAG: hypothetical protein U0441_17940 [Polyangiaceae bacterium]